MAVLRLLWNPRTGSLLCAIASSESCAAAEGLNVDDANQPPLSSSSESSSSEEDPKSSGNLNAYNKNEKVRTGGFLEGKDINPRRSSLTTTRTRVSIIARSEIRMSADFSPLRCTFPKLFLTLRNFTCDFLHCPYGVQSTCGERSTRGGSGDILFIDLPRSGTPGSCQGESGFPSSKEACVFAFCFLVTAVDILIPFGLRRELHDDEAEVRRRMFQSGEHVF